MLYLSQIRYTIRCGQESYPVNRSDYSYQSIQCRLIRGSGQLNIGLFINRIFEAVYIEAGIFTVQ